MTAAASLMTGQTVERSPLLSMAGQTPSHFEARSPGCVRHLLHSAMTVDTFHSMMEMHLMRKIDEIRKALEPDPLNRRPIFPIPQKFLGFGCFFPEVLVASHAELHGRDTGDG